MAQYKTVSIKFWRDSKVIDNFTPEDRYFYLYLITNPYGNLAGCYELSIKMMAIDTGYSQETIKLLIDRFINVHKAIDYDYDTKEVLIINWHKYNWTSSDKFRKPLWSNIEEIKSERFRKYLTDLFNGIDTRYGIDTICIDTKDIDIDKDIDKDTDKEINNIIDIWIEYKKNAGWVTTQELEMARKVITDKINQHGTRAVKMCIEQSIANGYKGIVWGYIEKPKKKGEMTGREYSDGDYSDIEAQLLKKR